MHTRTHAKSRTYVRIDTHTDIHAHNQTHTSLQVRAQYDHVDSRTVCIRVEKEWEVPVCVCLREHCCCTVATLLLHCCYTVATPFSDAIVSTEGTTVKYLRAEVCVWKDEGKVCVHRVLSACVFREMMRVCVRTEKGWKVCVSAYA
jgi:hypothetical protein